MPELAEVKIMSEYINHVSKDKKFLKIRKSPENKNPEIEHEGEFLIKARNRGKELILDINEKHLLCNMGMSGNWIFVKTNQEPKHSHLMFDTTNGYTLALVDFRRFSRWKWVESWSDNRGPCVLTEWDEFVKNIYLNIDKREFEKPLYDIMMNQKYFNGLGAYLVAEILGRWDKNPLLPAKNSIDNNLLLLCNRIPKQSYDLNGGQLKDWGNPFNKENNNFKEWLLFYQNKEVCVKIPTSKKRFIWVKKVFFT